MTDNSKIVFNFLKSIYPQPITAQEAVAAIGNPDIKMPTVTGSVNGLVGKKYAIRNEETVTGDDGKEKTVKYIVLTEEGYAFDPEAETKDQK